MHNWKNRVLAAALAFCMLAAMLVIDLPARAAEQLVNVALQGSASSPNGSAGGNVIGNVIDGKLDTNWQTSGVWPSTAVVQLDMGRTISEVVVKLGGDDSAVRTVTVDVKYAQNGVTSDLIAVGTKTVTLTGSKEARFTLDTPVSATHFYVTLSDPTQDGVTYTGMWPCVAEIEIYEKQDVRLSNYNNIAAQAKISATGNNEHDSEGSANLVDKSTSTLYKFYKDQLTQEESVILTFEQARAMDAFVIAFENVGENDQYNYGFTYSILARNGDGAYETIVANATANRTDNSTQQYKFLEKTYTEVKITMHACTNNTGNYIGWPAIAEFEVYGSEVTVADGCISNGKVVHASSGQSTARNITDGSKNSIWRGSYYPGYVDIDLGANYRLEAVEVYTPESGYSQYSIYTSLNGRDFDKLGEKTSRDQASLATGESYPANGKEARIVRVYLEYNSNETAAVINEVRVLGEATGTPVQPLPNIAVVDFDKSDYANMTVTAQDTYNEVYGIIERRLGPDYKSWFTLELAPSANTYDYFELSTVDGKVHVKGNDGVSLATGINHYLKYYCNVNISQVGDQVTMPATAPVISTPVHKETKAEVRYSYNYCTLSYSMAFWGETEWRNELDWLALNGVNVVLDATAQEEVWRRFLGKLGYTHQEAKDYIAGPAYYAWAYMANLSGFGGPVHDSWFEERTELARKNQKIMRNLGMQPVLQGYSGMVPTDITSKATGNYALSSSDIIAQGNWCSFQRPAMLVTTSAAFDKYAELFYACQKEVYGDTSDYYATDPFHEGGNTGGMSATAIAREVLTSMLAADSNAIWIIQAWQGNPTTALLNGLDEVTNGAQHALVLDLYAEKTPHNQETGSSYGDTKEFDATPWLYCMLNNFGGRLGLHGHLDNLANKIPEAFNNNTCIAGIGITPEASVNNPVLYDFFFETIWQDDASARMEVIDLNTWLDDYATRRYGASSTSANQAWDILKDTVYKGSLNNLGQGAPESVVNARPALSIKAASTWGNAVVSYDKVLLEEAALLLLEDYDVLKESKGYMYDVANVLQQVLSNSAQEYQKKMAAAFNAKDLTAFESYSAKFLEIIGYMETVTATSEYFLLGRWVEQAKALADNADDFTRDLYEFNAKALVTTWGSYNQAESGGLKDYSNRQWSGLIGDFYKVRWERWITARTNELKGESYESNINWFQWEWEWVRSNKTYTTAATTADLETLGYEILEKFTAANPAANSANDVDPDTIGVYAENYQPNNATEGDPNYVLDGNPNTIWHTVWRDSERSTHYLIFTFEEVTEISGMRFLQRPSGSNGVITKFDLLVRESADDAWRTVSLNATTSEWTTVVDDGVLSTDTSWQMVEFAPVKALQVKLQVVDANSGEVGKKFAAAAEVRFTVPVEEKCKHESYTDGICDNCGAIHPDAVASVTVGDTVTYYLTMESAIEAAANINADATITVIRDTAVTQWNNKLVSKSNVDLMVNEGVTLTMSNVLYLGGDLGGNGTIGGTSVLFVRGTTENVTVTCDFAVYGTIQSGTFTGEVRTIRGTIAGGTFSGTVVNEAGGTITDGIFNGAVTNQGRTNYDPGIPLEDQWIERGTITGGTFNAEVRNKGGLITGGTFNGTLTNADNIEPDSDENGDRIDVVTPGMIINTETPTTFTLGEAFSVEKRGGTIECTSHIWDSTGTCRLCGVQAVATVTIGETTTYYLDLQAALDAAVAGIEAAPAMVTVLKDVELDGEVYANGGVFTLDLNGFELSCPAGYGSVINVSNGTGKMTVIDTSEAQTGKMTSAMGSCIYQNGGIVNILGGTFSGNSEFALYVQDGGLMNIKGGTIRCGEGTLFGRESPIRIGNQGAVIVSGGTISGGNYDFNFQGSSASLVLSIDDNGVGATFPGGLSLYCYENESTLNSVLAEGAAYWQNGKPLSVDDGATEITGGDVTVEAVCDHSGNTNTQYIDNGDGTHSLICSVCDAAVETAEHTGGEAICETGKICETCGAEYTNALGHDDADKDHVCDNGCNVPQGEHKAAKGSHDCGYCGEAVTECADTNKDHNCDTCGTKLSECADTDSDHNCDLCGDKLSDCADADKDHNCDTCGEKLSDCGDTKPADHKCDICGKVLSTCADKNEDGKCDICGAITVPAKPYKITNVVSGVHVYWKAVPGATKYGLWRSETGKDGTYKWVANPTVPHFTDTKVESGKTYHYKVTTMVGTQHSAKSDAIGVIYVGTPDITSRFNKAAGITVGWNEIEGATGYAIYRKSYDGDDAWVRVATIEGNETFTWQDTSVKDNNGTVYRYTVRALAGKDMKTLSGCRNVGRTMARLTSRTLNSAVKASATSIKCSWTTTKLATGYEVRFMVGSTVYKTFTIGNYATGVKTFTGLQAGQTYKIQVRSYLKVDGMGFYSAWSTAKTVKLP